MGWWNTGRMGDKNDNPIFPFIYSFIIPIIIFVEEVDMYKKILVPLDGSELAKKALNQAEKLANIFGSEIILFQVVPFMPIYGSPELVTPLIVDEKQKEAAERYLLGLAEELKQRGLKVSVAVKTGQQVAVEIIDFAKESRVDLIVMCTHGRSGITRWVLGSIALKVLTRAETPILLLRSKD
jgi:nucleotide-binding universal stress UspA family protein